MDKVYSSIELQPIEYFPQNDGTAVVYLRDNIVKDYKDNEDGTSYEFWEADEVKLVTDLPHGEVAENFDQLWVKAEVESKTIEERLSEIEGITETLVAMALGEEE